MAISGFIGAGVQDALSQQIAEQLRREIFEEEQRQAKARENLMQQEQTRRSAEDITEADLRRQAIESTDTARRDRANQAGVEEMYRQREVMDREDQGRQIQQVLQGMPAGPVPRAINLNRIGAGWVRPEHVMTPEEQAAASKQELAGEVAKTEAIEGVRAKYRPEQAPRQPSFVTMPDGSVRDVMGVAPEGATPYQRPVRQQLTPSETATQTRMLRGQFTRDVATTREIRRQATMMEAGMDAARRGDLAAGSQAVLVTFQKILDPTSVVRESEYARSASGQALMSRIEGAATRLAQGGAGVPLAELQKFADLANAFVSNAAENEGEVRQHYVDMANEFGLNPDLVVGRQAPTEPAPSPAGAETAPATHRWNPQTKRLEPVR